MSILIPDEKIPTAESNINIKNTEIFDILTIEDRERRIKALYSEYENNKIIFIDNNDFDTNYRTSNEYNKLENEVEKISLDLNTSQTEIERISNVIQTLIQEAKQKIHLSQDRVDKADLIAQYLEKFGNFIIDDNNDDYIDGDYRNNYILGFKDRGDYNVTGEVKINLLPNTDGGFFNQISITLDNTKASYLSPAIKEEQSDFSNKMIQELTLPNTNLAIID